MDITSTPIAFQAAAESQSITSAAIQPQPAVVSPKDGYYFYMPLRATLLRGFDLKDTDWVNTIWGEFVNTFLQRASGMASNSQYDAVHAFSGWLLPPCRDQIMRDTGKSAREARKLAKFLAELGPRAMTMLVVDFVGNLNSAAPPPAFNDFEYLCYQTGEGLEQGTDKFRIVAPLSSAMPIAKFERLQSTIQKWVDFCAGDQPSDPASYEIGRICAMPGAAPSGAQHTRAFHNRGCATLNWQAFETMFETGSLEMVID